MTKPDEHTPHIVGNGILPVKGKLILGGTPKANKSWVAMNMALSLAKGANLFDAFSKEGGRPIFPVYKSHRVLFLEAELGHQGTKDRLAQMLPNPEDTQGLAAYFHTRDIDLRLDTPEGQAKIEQAVMESQPDVVFLDPLAKFHGANEDSSQEMGRVLRYGDMLIEKYGCSIVYTHHTNKPSKDNPRTGGDRLRGSSAIFGDTDAVIMVTRYSAENAIEPVLKFDFELRRGEPMRAKYLRRMRNGVVVYIGDYPPAGG